MLQSAERKNGSQVLSGLKAIEVGEFISAPYCAKLLADLGAEVIKVEKPGVGDLSRQYGPFPGDTPHPERSGLFLYLNSNKLGITLNLETVTGRRILKELLTQADILIENYPPPVAKEYGLDEATFAESNPGLVVTSITPFGQTGPYKNYKAYAINCSAAGGMSKTIGEPDREPLTPPLSLGHFQSGATAAMATMAAILTRNKDGQGRHIDVSEAEVWATIHTGNAIHHYVFTGGKRYRGGHRTPGYYPYTILPCKNGYVSLITILGRQWRAFIQLVGGGEVPDWYAEDSRFGGSWRELWKYADELDDLLAPWLMSHTKEEIFTLCQERHIPVAPVRDIGETVEEPHFRERQYFVEVDHPEAGRLKYPGAPYKLSKTPWRITHRAPLLSEHNQQIYCQRLGYSKDEFVQLRMGGII